MRAFKKFPEAMAKGIQDAVLQLGVYTAGEVKQVITSGEEMWKSPIDTGMMRRGIQAKQTGKLKAIITPSQMTPYALFVHQGTRFMRSRPFFEITARTRKDKIQNFFQGAIDKIVKDTLK